ncbi:MAG: hypothetical protein ACK5EV_04750 [Burkholderiales bacterium]|jgi:hypothetical protein
MKKVLLCFAAFFAALASGCALNDGRPMSSTMEIAPVPKLKSSTHWQVVANDVANNLITTARDQQKPLWITDVPKTKFGAVFSSQLLSNLVSSGVVVSRSSPEALQISFSTEEVQHLSPWHYKPGTLTVLSTNVAVIRGALLGTILRNTPSGAIIGLGVGNDIALTLNEMSERPSTEIVLTTKIERNGQLLMHRTDSYYIDGVDSSLFSAPTGKNFKVVGAD